MEEGEGEDEDEEDEEEEEEEGTPPPATGGGNVNNGWVLLPIALEGEGADPPFAPVGRLWYSDGWLRCSCFVLDRNDLKGLWLGIPT